MTSLSSSSSTTFWVYVACSEIPAISSTSTLGIFFLCEMYSFWAQAQRFIRAILVVLTLRRGAKSHCCGMSWCSTDGFESHQVQLGINNIIEARTCFGDIANSDCDCFARTAFNSVSRDFTNPWTAQGFFTPAEVISDFWEHLQSGLAKVKETGGMEALQRPFSCLHLLCLSVWRGGIT